MRTPLGRLSISTSRLGAANLKWIGILLCIGAVTAGIVARTCGEVPDAPGVGPAADPLPPVESVQQGTTEVRTVEEPEQSEPAGLTFARNFWGERWPLVKADLEEQGKSVDWRTPPGVTWEEAAVELGEKLLPLGEGQRAELIAGNLLQWSGTPDAEWFRTSIGWTAAVPVEALPRIQEVVERHNVEIEPLAHEWADRLDFEIRGAWRAGRYEHGPFTLPRGTPGNYIWTSAQGYRGWAARMSLTFDDCPGLADLLREIRRKVAARNAEVRLLLN